MSAAIQRAKGHPPGRSSMTDTARIFVGQVTGSKGPKGRLDLLLARANRHGLIAGATGTGKTATLQGLAEGFAASGVPVFVADVKGDLSGISQEARVDDRLGQRIRDMGIADFEPMAAPAIFWDLFGRQGHPVRATISDFGPLLLGRLMNLNEVQTGVLNLAVTVADEQGLLLLDLKDLRALLAFVSEQSAELQASHGNANPASIGAIQRALLLLEQQGAESFFGEPMLDIADLMRADGRGRGYVNVLAADKLMQSPQLYATFLLWLLSELYENLPEAGDLPKPKLVLFFDEAHLLFKDAPKALADKVEQVVRLIRSKGVGVFFVTQNPLDIPESVLGQLGNRVQHALRAYTPRDQKAVRAAAETFRANPKLNTEKVIQELGVGEALVSLLDDKGAPGIVQRATIRPPQSRLGPASPGERAAVMTASPVAGSYDQAIDRESAYERLTGRAAGHAPATPAPTSPTMAAGAGSGKWGRGPLPPARPMPSAQPAPESGGIGGALGSVLGGVLGGGTQPAPRGGRQPQSVGAMVGKAVVRSIATQIGSQIGRQIIRGVLGSILK
jgi:DNA helicase HerA-like ATPase